MAETIKAIFEQPTIPMAQRDASLPPRLCEIIDRALMKDPTQRWQSAQAMRTALLHVAQ
jgi:serine/threonine protein kinase